MIDIRSESQNTAVLRKIVALIVRVKTVTGEYYNDTVISFIKHIFFPRKLVVPKLLSRSVLLNALFHWLQMLDKKIALHTGNWGRRVWFDSLILPGFSSDVKSSMIKGLYGHLMQRNTKTFRKLHLCLPTVSDRSSAGPIPKLPLTFERFFRRYRV